MSKRKVKATKGTEYFISVYTKGAWEALGYDVETWETGDYGNANKTLTREMVVENKRNAEGEFKYDFDDSLCVVVLDEDYVKWLEKNNRHDGDESFIYYVATLSGDKMKQKFKSSDCGIYTKCVAMPVLYESMDGEPQMLMLDKKECAELEKLAEHVYPGFKCHVPGYILDGEGAMVNSILLSEDAETWYSKNVSEPDPEWLEQPFLKNTLETVLFVPVYIQGELKDIVYRNSDYEEGGRLCAMRNAESIQGEELSSVFDSVAKRGKGIEKMTPYPYFVAPEFGREYDDIIRESLLEALFCQNTGPITLPTLSPALL